MDSLERTKMGPADQAERLAPSCYSSRHLSPWGQDRGPYSQTRLRAIEVGVGRGKDKLWNCRNEDLITTKHSYWHCPTDLWSPSTLFAAPCFRIRNRDLQRKKDILNRSAFPNSDVPKKKHTIEHSTVWRYFWNIRSLARFLLSFCVRKAGKAGSELDSFGLFWIRLHWVGGTDSSKLDISPTVVPNIPRLLSLGKTCLCYSHT